MTALADEIRDDARAGAPTSIDGPARTGRGRASGFGGLGGLGGLGGGLIAALVLPASLAVVWELAAAQAWIDARLLPPPSAIGLALAHLAADGSLALHIEATLVRVTVGFACGAVVATVLGALTGYAARAHSLLDPTLQALRAIPSLAWVPLFILWFGIFETSKVLLIAVGAFFPVYLALSTAVRQVDRKLVEVGRVARLSGLALVWRILLPAALPAYLVGLRGGLGLAWMFVVAAEVMGASEGLGYLLVDGQMSGRPATILAAIVAFAVLGKSTDLVLAAAGRPLVAWQDGFRPD